VSGKDAGVLWERGLVREVCSVIREVCISMAWAQLLMQLWGRFVFVLWENLGGTIECRTRYMVWI
jgi:hypothetical protein